MPSQHPQDTTHALSVNEPERFWLQQASHLHWHLPPTGALAHSSKSLPSGVSHPTWRWFPSGQISNCYNCLDRHVRAGKGAEVAVYFDSPVSGAKEVFTYETALREVEVLAGVLREEGVGKGDVVVIYMPMIPAALFAMLAVNRLGAVHAVVFGGFSPPSLAQRLEAAKPKAVMTASCGIEGGKGAIGYRSLITQAVEKSSFKPEKIIIWQREQLRWEPVVKGHGERDWQELVMSGQRRGVRADAVPVGSNDPIYIIYTSGTTGAPKGVVREAGGHAVGLNLSIRYLFGIRGPGDTIFTASDIGWVVGHSYIVYAPLLAGAATVLFEGKPVGTPDASTFWRIVEEYRVNALFTAPTALRAVRRDDPDNAFFSEIGRRGGLKTLRALFLAGERSEPSIVTMYQQLLETHCASDAMVVDNWWSSESGSPITGLAQLAATGLAFDSTERCASLPMKPGSAGKAMCGFDVRVLDDEGSEVKRGEMGNIVLGLPLAPTGMTTLWGDEERFYRGYLKRFGGRWMDTGDAGMIDEDGYVHIMSRADDIINVAAHRLSTGSLEQAISSHPSIAECCVVPIPDSLKGHLPFAFITLSQSPHPSAAVPDPALYRQLNERVRQHIGAIASLGGIVQGAKLIPKTRSGKTLRRVLRELLDMAVRGELEGELHVPNTIDDPDVVDVARARVREYFALRGARHRPTEEGRAKL